MVSVNKMVMNTEFHILCRLAFGSCCWDLRVCVCILFPLNVLTGCRHDVLYLWCLMDKSSPQKNGDLLKEEVQVEGAGEV